jgi:hypothetical protein
LAEHANKTAISRTDSVAGKIGSAIGAAKPDVFDISNLRIVEAPRILLHSGEGEPGKSHMRMWIPCLQESGVSFAVLVRNAKLYNFIRATYPDVSIALATTPEHVEAVLSNVPLVRAVLYSSNTGNNIHLQRFSELTHVFVGHGSVEKAAGTHKAFRVYDEIWVAGEADIDRFRDAGFDLGHLKFVKIGRPTLFQAVSESAKTPWSQRFEKPTLLYLPNWEGDGDLSCSSLPMASELLSEALNAVDGVGLFKLHPSTGVRNSSYRSAEWALLKYFSERPVEAVDRLAPLEDVIPTANIFICDISTAITDCLSADAPIFVYKAKNHLLKPSESNMQLEKYAYMFSDAAELKTGLLRLMTDGDVLAPLRAEAQQYLMGKQEILDRRFEFELQALSVQ